MDVCPARKRKALTSRHPNVEKPEGSELAVFSTKRHTVTCESIILDRNEETAGVKVEQSSERLQETSGRRIDVAGESPNPLSDDELMDYAGKIWYAPEVYRNARVSSIVNLNFENIGAAIFIHFFRTCVPHEIRDLRLEHLSNMPVGISHQLKLCLLDGCMENLVIRECTRLDGGSVFPANVLQILSTVYTNFKNIVLRTPVGVEQEDLTKFVASLVESERPLKFVSISLNFGGSPDGLDAKIAAITGIMGANMSSGRQYTFHNNHGKIFITLSKNMVSLKYGAYPQ